MSSGHRRGPRARAMKAAGFASNADIARWDAARPLTALTADPPTIFFPIFGAVGRRPS